jgi:uncharacterized protein (DUF433 family)
MMIEVPSQWHELGQRGAFTTTQVARLVREKPATVADWISGPNPLVESGLGSIAGRHAMTFDALIEIRAVKYLLKNGISRRKLAKIMNAMRLDTGQKNPLTVDRILRTDGAAVFEEDDGKLVDLFNRMYASEDLLRPGLEGRVQFNAGRAAWFLPYPEDLPLVRIDPRRAFGRPIVVVANAAVPTATLAANVKLDGVAGVADWYDLPTDAVTQAVAFETRLAA